MFKKIHGLFVMVCMLAVCLQMPIMAEENYLWPVVGSTHVSQPYNEQGQHFGMDIDGGGDIVATKSGKVIKMYDGCNNFSGRKNGTCEARGICKPNSYPDRGYCNYGYGKGAVIQHDDGSGYSMYAHLSSICVKEGQRVTQGTKLGVMGATGNADGIHLHFVLCKSVRGGPNYYTEVNHINPGAISYKYQTSGNSGSITVNTPDDSNKVKITLDPNGGTVSPGYVMCAKNGTYGKLPTPTKKGYTFSNWTPDKEGMFRETVSENTSIRGGSAHTLYALWSANKYTVKFDANGGSVSYKSKTVTFGNKYGELPIPKKEGYTFLGWGANKDSKTYYTAGSVVNTAANHTLYACWDANTITVSATVGKGGEITPGGEIKVKKGESISFDIYPDTGYEIDEVYIDGKERGNRAYFDLENITEPHVIEVIFYEKTVKEFKDVPPQSIWKDAVDWAVKNEITYGVTDAHFMPYNTCTRGQAVTFIWRAMGKPSVKARNPFKDIDSSSPYYEAVLWAYKNKITSGQTKDTFNPDGLCTEAHILTFLWRACGQPNADKMGSLGENYMGQYYSDALNWAKKTGILTDSITPDKESPRAHIVYYLYKYFDK